MASYFTAAVLILASMALVFGRPSEKEELFTGTVIIRSVQGGLILQSLGSGEHCVGAGHVVASKSVENAKSAQWMYRMWGLSASFHIIGGDLNEFSFHPRGLFCYPPGRTVNLVKHDKGTISFQDFDGTCLTNNGNGERISWTSCNGNSPSQRWTMEEILE
ncbi:uncharacterized protein LOC110857457 [Folsomia candida]|uniref:uncharacterized protein LOC110857457 n=1 Tax=Folsomia candida TaxID=158441 RepID=UPI00160559AD|nr:uncharacterized protein LOC110857457 [Folsomia candida]